MDFASLTDKELLALCIYGEARGETALGKLAVAHVILNRAARPCWWGKDVKSVILKPYQFSCFNADDPNRERLIRQAKSGYYDPACLTVACLALDGYTVNPVDEATHYHSTGITAPSWVGEMRFVRHIGRHIFYVED